MSMPVLEDQVAQVDKRLASEMEEHIRNGHIPKRKDCPICQQAQGPVVRHYQHPTRFEHLACGFDWTSDHRSSRT
eukprot:12931287-Prorocentrum_lima.AAC.1